MTDAQIIAKLTAADPEFSMDIDLNIAWGNAKIKGTRITTEAVMLAFSNIPSASGIMRLFDLTAKQVNDCILFYKTKHEN